MNQQLETENADLFQTALEKQYLQNNSADPMQKMKAQAWQYFLQMGLPNKRTEAFRYLKLRQLFSRSYAPSQITKVTSAKIAPYIYPESARSILVFVNGHYQPALSNTTALSKKISVSSLPDAMRTYGTFLNNQWAKISKEESDPFAVINAAMHRDGVFIYLPPKTVVDAPIQILHVTDTEAAPMFMLPRLNLFVGAHSQVDIATSYITLSGKHYCTNQLSDIAMEEGSSVRFIQTSDESLDSEHWHFEALRAHLKRDSRLTTICASKGSSTVRYSYKITLAGENCEAALNGIWTLDGNREAHTHITIDHQAPNCRSMQLFKTVLDDTSRSSFEGKILVQQEAQKTDAFQLNNNLLLSDHAQANSKPNLEIFADDVKASHGATVGQLDSEQLFYMKTRGFSEAEAKSMLVYSFCKEVIDRIPISSLQQRLSKTISYGK